jgi:hypothetical protein
MEVQPYYASKGDFVRFGGPPVLADKHQSTTAMERDTLRPDLAASGLIVDGPTSILCRRSFRR